MLHRLNVELDGNFNLADFSHEAIYDETLGRIEMRLISQREQMVLLAGREILFEAGAFIITEYSYKYSLEGFSALARIAGWEPERSWVDDERLFSMHYLTVKFVNS